MSGHYYSAGGTRDNIYTGYAGGNPYTHTTSTAQQQGAVDFTANPYAR